jgi:hypothetical protein
VPFAKEGPETQRIKETAKLAVFVSPRALLNVAVESKSKVESPIKVLPWKTFVGFCVIGSKSDVFRIDPCCALQSCRTHLAINVRIMGDSPWRSARSKWEIAGI